MPLNQEQQPEGTAVNNGLLVTEDSVVDIRRKINDLNLAMEEEVVGGLLEIQGKIEDIKLAVEEKNAKMLDMQVHLPNSEVVSETVSFLEGERVAQNEHKQLENSLSDKLSLELNDYESTLNNHSEGEHLKKEHDQIFENMTNGEEDVEFPISEDHKLIVVDTDELAHPVVDSEIIQADPDILEKLELHISEADLVEEVGNRAESCCEQEVDEQPEHPDKLELHISETDLHDNDAEGDDSAADGKDGREIYSCQSSPGYIKPPSVKSGIVKQKSLDTQVTSDDESEGSRVKRGSLHSPSSKIITKMTPITWDQWMKRPASYVPPQKPPSTEASKVDGKPAETKAAPVGESPKVKKTRFQIIPQTPDVLEISRDEAKPLDTFDETEEDEFLMKNPNMLLDSHLNQLTMVESQLKKLGAAAKAGSKKLTQTQETDGRAMKRTSSADEKGKGWLGWLSVFTKKAPPSPSPPPKKQPAGGAKRGAPRKTRRLAAPPLLPEYPKIVYIEVQYSCSYVEI